MLKQLFNEIFQSQLGFQKIFWMIRASFFHKNETSKLSVEFMSCICTFGHSQHPLGPEILPIGGVHLNIHVYVGDVFIWISHLSFLYSQSQWEKQTLLKKSN